MKSKSDKKEQKIKSTSPKTNIINDIINTIKYLFLFAFNGIKEFIASFYYVFVLAYVALKKLIIFPFTAIFNGLSSKVDNVYQNTKTKTPVKERIENGKMIIPESKASNDSFFKRIWKVLNSDVGGKTKEKHLSQKAITKLEEQRHELQKELTSPDLPKYKEAKVFLYTARTQSGKWVKGRFYGFSKADVNAYLLNENYDVYKIENNKWIDFLYGETSIGKAKMSTKDLIFWLTQLSTYVKAGITLNDAVKIIMNQSIKDKKKLGIYQSIAYELTMGNSFSTALEKQGNVFPIFLINMLRAAEATGKLEETLDEMVNYYTDIETTRKEMINALMYPIIIMIFSFGVILFVLLYVIPRFSDVYKSMNVSLSGLTLFLLNLSQFLSKYGILLLIGFIIFLIILFMIYKRIKAFRQRTQLFLMKLPVIGNIIIYKEMSTFAKTFASLLENSVDITKSIDILSKITNNEIYKEIMVNTIDNIAKGEKISEAFRDHFAIPDVAFHMITTGESTGQLAEMMKKVGAFYQEQHHSVINNMKSLIEPIMIVLLAVIVGVILISVILPMFQMYNDISFG